VVTNNIPPMNPVNTGNPLSTEVAALREWARITAERIYHGTKPELQEELERKYNNSICKRRRSPEPDLQAGPIQCTTGSNGRGSADPPRAMRTKRRREVATQRGEIQEQHVGSIPVSEKSRSKLGHARTRENPCGTARSLPSTPTGGD
jgi:hypothetical protein